MFAFVLPNGRGGGGSKAQPQQQMVRVQEEPEDAEPEAAEILRPLRMKYDEAVDFYKDPASNQQMEMYCEKLFAQNLSYEEKRMLFFTVESLSSLLYAVYDHLFFHSYERMFDIGRKEALKEMGERETKILEALEPVVEIIFQRADSFRDRQETPCSPAFGEVLANLERNWKKDIAGLWRAIPKATGI